MSLTDLPDEVLLHIVALALNGATVPSDILRVCRLLHDIGLECLYTNLRFSASTQLYLFSLSPTPALPVAPRSITVDLAGKHAEFHLFGYLRDAFLKCRQQCAAAGKLDQSGRVPLRFLCLRMHSYSKDTMLQLFEEALGAISPEAFEWTGPDPDHHFSTAIIAPVSARLFKIFGIWSNIREIKVTNITFAGTGSSQDEKPLPPLLSDIPSLRMLYIGQATFLHPQAVAGVLGCGDAMAGLEEFRLVDAYSESIWGPRLRRSDVEKAMYGLCGVNDRERAIARIRRIISCEKKTERIMGGDRVEGTNVLD
ncbi:hypothetical protein F5I97DRAFT_146666 [Phlebopus sp. FC_14]|nr:hypothetical protein F5I97DRAFT_146666 [Phlebopus sp. FC_14]